MKLNKDQERKARDEEKMSQKWIRSTRFGDRDQPGGQNREIGDFDDEAEVVDSVKHWQSFATDLFGDTEESWLTPGLAS